eukprot:6204368-Pleurochrysis_carterae.AAC.1
MYQTARETEVIAAAHALSKAAAGLASTTGPANKATASAAATAGSTKKRAAVPTSAVKKPKWITDKM